MKNRATTSFASGRLTAQIPEPTGGAIGSSGQPFKGRRPFFIGDDVTDETVFAIMPDLDGLAFSVGRRAKGVAGHFDAPSDVREFLAHLLDDERDVSSP